MQGRQHTRYLRLGSVIVVQVVLLVVVLLIPPPPQPPDPDPPTPTRTDTSTPTTPTDTPTSTPGPCDGYAVGNTVRTTDDGIYLRTEASTSDRVVATIMKGKLLVILDGCKEADGHRWWRVREKEAPAREGWMADDWWELVNEADNTGRGSTGTP